MNATSTALGEAKRQRGERRGEQESSPKDPRVGIVTYDKDLHFYNLKAGLDHAQMMVMPDLEDPFVPLSDGLFVDPDESKDIITKLPDSATPDIFSRHSERAEKPRARTLAHLECRNGRARRDRR